MPNPLPFDLAEFIDKPLPGGKYVIRASVQDNVIALAAIPEQVAYHKKMLSHHELEYGKALRRYKLAESGSADEKKFGDLARAAKAKLEHHKKLYDRAMTAEAPRAPSQRAPAHRSSPAYWSATRNKAIPLISAVEAKAYAKYTYSVTVELEDGTCEKPNVITNKLSIAMATVKHLLKSEHPEDTTNLIIWRRPAASKSVMDNEVYKTFPYGPKAQTRLSAVEARLAEIALLTANRSQKIGLPVLPKPKMTLPKPVHTSLPAADKPHPMKPAAPVKPSPQPKPDPAPKPAMAPKPVKPVTPEEGAQHKKMAIPSTHKQHFDGLAEHLKNATASYQNKHLGAAAFKRVGNAASTLEKHYHNLGHLVASGAKEIAKEAKNRAVHIGKEDYNEAKDMAIHPKKLAKYAAKEGKGYAKTVAVIPSLIDTAKAAKHLYQSVVHHHGHAGTAAVHFGHHLMHAGFGALLAHEAVENGLEWHNKSLESGAPYHHALAMGVAGAAVGLLKGGVLDHFAKGKGVDYGARIFEKPEEEKESAEARFLVFASDVGDTVRSIHIKWIKFAEKFFGKLAKIMDHLSKNYTMEQVIEAMVEVQKYEKTHSITLTQKEATKMANKIMDEKKRSPGNGYQDLALAKSNYKDLPLETRANLFALDPKEQERGENAVAAMKMKMKYSYTDKEKRVVIKL